MRPALFVSFGNEGRSMTEEQLKLPEIPGIKLTQAQEYRIRQALANMALEDMMPDRETIKAVMLVEAGVKTMDELDRELLESAAKQD